MKLYAPLAVAYVALVVLANWLASRYLITVPFTHYIAPAGVLCIGAVLVLRDWLWQLRGFRASVVLIGVAGVLSYVIGVAAGYGSLQRIALASLAAFVVSEGIFESLVFAPLRKRHLTLGVALSASVGNLVDSFVFLVLAFPAFWTDLYAGNVVGKGEMIAVGVVLTAARRKLIPVGRIA
jgi:uncharacterized PurR-regulated membrane protein YhhQ (DUF165 family)